MKLLWMNRLILDTNMNHKLNLFQRFIRFLFKGVFMQELLNLQNQVQATLELQTRTLSAIQALVLQTQNTVDPQVLQGLADSLAASNSVLSQTLDGLQPAS